MGELLAVILFISFVWWVWTNLSTIFSIILGIGVLAVTIWIILEPAKYLAKRLSIHIKEWLAMRDVMKDLKNKEKNIEKEFEMRLRIEKKNINSSFSSTVMNAETRNKLSKLYEEAEFVLFKQKTDSLMRVEELRKDVYEIHNGEFNNEDKIGFYQNIKDNV